MYVWALFKDRVFKIDFKALRLWFNGKLSHFIETDKDDIIISSWISFEIENR